MTPTRMCSALCILAVLASCESDAPSASIDAAAEALAITRLEDQWSAMYGTRDLEGIVSLLARESVLIMPGSAPVVGGDAIEEATSVMLDSGDTVSWTSDFASVAPSGDMAYDYGTALTTLSDGTAIEGNYLVVWIKEDGEWKVAADMFN